MHPFLIFLHRTFWGTIVADQIVIVRLENWSWTACNFLSWSTNFWRSLILLVVDLAPLWRKLVVFLISDRIYDARRVTKNVCHLAWETRGLYTLLHKHSVDCNCLHALSRWKSGLLGLWDCQCRLLIELWVITSLSSVRPSWNAPIRCVWGEHLRSIRRFTWTEHLCKISNFVWVVVTKSRLCCGFF